MNHILWIDLEMTGLDPEKEVIIEVGAIITDAVKLEELDRYHCVVRQHKEFLDNMDKWNTKVHQASGLYDLIPTGKTEAEVERGLIQFIDKHFKDEPAVIAGNSISQDRAFIKKYFRELESRLHYRMLDVTAWKLIVEKEGIVFDKKNRHRALDDIEESLAEMRFYLQFMDRNKILSYKQNQGS
ncbi:MAG: oligoribonuclease [Bdellovibrionales bacterium]|nr:oligoribonuclease [Bdellovibrionales bacterium]